ncbi:cellulose biosynthesis cyclic di-GMP-binding regulatory protein BcsB [Martelella alba]|uniref:Cyclic di-GMP-binding protein n=1 Tax=Martelella alba TaxID=2590451 RepID=A0ABY2SR06_9HYPH|nr:cellulose biosynthesis cyclic di-GMP-binding regulatory protein BcsB [Martelella alba]TKI07815.1 cellulose biosynthesis cyclic di-GMP-binding regulatory protein BcsB [Martelella alba]
MLKPLGCLSLFIGSLCAVPAAAFAQPTDAGETSASVGAGTPDTALSPAPVREVRLRFADTAPAPGTFTLRGISPEGQIEFGVRSDEVVTQARLALEFTPSPSLIPQESHLKVYLNDQLVGVVPITKDQLGKSNRTTLDIDPLYITDFNRLRLEFVGHYQDICENPANTALWLDIGKTSSLNLRLQRLPLVNELSHFPEPFFDSRDTRPLVLPMVFAGAPDTGQQRAAAILASWFGMRAQWRGQTFPVLFDQVPDRHAVVFATNDRRPGFLRDYPPVRAPTIEMIDSPGDPYVKLLLIMGRNDDDLVTAVKGIAQGNILFRGQRLTVEQVRQLAPRRPYDAPNWVRTDRPMTFGELKQYPEQLEASGVQPAPLTMRVNLPPDLFLIHNAGIDMRLKYRYTAPQRNNDSRLNISLNNQFVQGYTLGPDQDQGSAIVHLPLLQGLFDSAKSLTIPALKLGETNQFKFEFDYTQLLASGTEGRCETYSIAGNHVVIDDSSTLDFSGYRHFMPMPDLHAFVNAGFPFSRMADLSETLTLVNPRPQPDEVATLLDALGNIGALTGYPALGLRLGDDWRQAGALDADILIIGALPPSLRDDRRLNLLVDATRGWIKQPNRPEAPANHALASGDAPPYSDTRPDSRTVIDARGPLAAIIGVQSPTHDQRSIVALLADSQAGFALLNRALANSSERAAVYGSVAVIRDAGVNSLRVGETYYVGHLPWWERIWNALATHPVLMAFMAMLTVILAALLLWRGLLIISRRRLSRDERD